LTEAEEEETLLRLRMENMNLEALLASSSQRGSDIGSLTSNYSRTRSQITEVNDFRVKNKIIGSINRPQKDANIGAKTNPVTILMKY